VNVKVLLDGNEQKYVLDALEEGWISSKGKYIQLFEQALENYLGVRHAVCVANGTCALHLALLALEIGIGDEVIVPNLTFAATANAVIHAGAEPVFVDSLPDSYNIDPQEVEKAITNKTKAIIAVHLYGQPCDMAALMKIAKKHNLVVIEDAAEALGASVLQRKVGTLGVIGCFSFFANKVITSGEGGACVTDDEVLAKKMRILKDHGMDPEKKYWHNFVGYNYRMTNLNAAIGLGQLEKIDEKLKQRSEIASDYDKYLSKISNISLVQKPKDVSSIDWVYCIFVDRAVWLIQGDIRDILILKFKENGVDVRPIFYPLHQMPPYMKYRAIGNLENSTYFGLSGVCLPLYPGLTMKEVCHISTTLNKILEDEIS
jgi:perosamine synthetase